MRHVRRNLARTVVVIALFIAIAILFTPKLSSFVVSAVTGIHMQAPESFYAGDPIEIRVWSGEHTVQVVVVDPAGIKRGCIEVRLEEDHEVCIVDMAGGIVLGPHTAMLYKDGYLLQDIVFMVKVKEKNVTVPPEKDAAKVPEPNVTKPVKPVHPNITVPEHEERANISQLGVRHRLVGKTVEVASDNITLVDCTNTSIVFNADSTASVLHATELEVKVRKKTGARVGFADVTIDCVGPVAGNTGLEGIFRAPLVQSIERPGAVQYVHYCTVSACKKGQCDSAVVGTGNKTVTLYLDLENSAPTTPIVVGPANNTFTSFSPLLEWNASVDPDNDAVTYLVQVDKHPDFSGLTKQPRMAKLRGLMETRGGEVMLESNELRENFSQAVWGAGGNGTLVVEGRLEFNNSQQDKSYAYYDLGLAVDNDFEFEFKWHLKKGSGNGAVFIGLASNVGAIQDIEGFAGAHIYNGASWTGRQRIVRPVAVAGKQSRASTKDYYVIKQGITYTAKVKKAEKTLVLNVYNEDKSKLLYTMWLNKTKDMSDLRYLIVTNREGKREGHEMLGWVDDFALSVNKEQGFGISEAVKPRELAAWVGFSADVDVPVGTSYLFTLLEETGDRPVPGFDGFTETERVLTGIDPEEFPGLRLMVEFNGTSTSTPIVKSWEISWANQELSESKSVGLHERGLHHWRVAGFDGELASQWSEARAVAPRRKWEPGLGEEIIGDAETPVYQEARWDVVGTESRSGLSVESVVVHSGGTARITGEFDIGGLEVQNGGLIQIANANGEIGDMRVRTGGKAEFENITLRHTGSVVTEPGSEVVRKNSPHTTRIQNHYMVAGAETWSNEVYEIGDTLNMDSGIHVLRGGSLTISDCVMYGWGSLRWAFRVNGTLKVNDTFISHAGDFWAPETEDTGIYINATYAPDTVWFNNVSIGQAAYSTGVGILLNNATGVSIIDSSFKTNQVAVEVLSGSGVDNLTIFNSTMHHNWNSPSYSIFMSGGNYLNLSKNHITGIEGSGMYIDTVYNGTVDENIFDVYTSGIELSYADNVSVDYNDITASGGFTTGINMYSCENNTVEYNQITSEEYGIYLGYDNTYNTFVNNTIQPTSIYSIYLYYSDYNYFKDDAAESTSEKVLYVDVSSDYNTFYKEDLKMSSISSSADTVYVTGSQYNEIINCTIDNDAYGAGIEIASSSYYNLAENNTITSEYDYGIYSGSGGIDVNYNEITSYNSGAFLTEGANVIGNDITTTTLDGIYMSSSSVSNIKDNRIDTNAYGIELYSSTGSNITGNEIFARAGTGLYISGVSAANITNNTINAGQRTGNAYGMQISDSTDCTIKNNTVDSNDFGIHLSTSSGRAMLQNNTVNTTSNQGIHIEDDNSRLEFNDVYSNYGTPLHMTSTTGEVLHNNTWASVTSNAWYLSSVTDVWASEDYINGSFDSVYYDSTSNNVTLENCTLISHNAGATENIYMSYMTYNITLLNTTYSETNAAFFSIPCIGCNVLYAWHMNVNVTRACDSCPLSGADVSIYNTTTGYDTNPYQTFTTGSDGMARGWGVENFETIAGVFDITPHNVTADWNPHNSSAVTVDVDLEIPMQMPIEVGPSIPTLEYPANTDNVDNNTFWMEWSDSTDCNGDPITYHVKLDNNSGFTNLMWRDFYWNYTKAYSYEDTKTSGQGLEIADWETYDWADSFDGGAGTTVPNWSEDQVLSCDTPPADASLDGAGAVYCSDYCDSATTWHGCVLYRNVTGGEGEHSVYTLMEVDNTAAASRMGVFYLFSYTIAGCPIALMYWSDAWFYETKSYFYFYTYPADCGGGTQHVAERVNSVSGAYDLEMYREGNTDWTYWRSGVEKYNDVGHAGSLTAEPAYLRLTFYQHKDRPIVDNFKVHDVVWWAPAFEPITAMLNTTNISVDPDGEWDLLYLNQTVNVSNWIEVTLFNATDNATIPGFEGITANITNISSIDASVTPDIFAQIKLTTTQMADHSPVLHNLTATWTKNKTTDSKHMSDELFLGQTYYWQVRATDGTYPSAWTSAWWFSINPEFSNVYLSATNNNNRTTENLTINFDQPPGDYYNVTDWRLDGSSISAINLPFENNVVEYSLCEWNVNNNGAGWVDTGKIGGAYDFELTDGDSLSINDPGANSPLDWSNFTVAAWIKPETIDIDQQIISKEEDALGDVFWVRVNSDNTIGVVFGNEIGASTGVGSTAAVDTNWHHVAAAFDDSNRNLTVYVDGILSGHAGTGMASVPANDETVYIGRRQEAAGPEYFDGIIDDLHVFNMTFEPVQVKQLYDESIEARGLATITSEQTKKGDNWTVEITLNELMFQWDYQLSNNVTIANSPPTHDKPVLNSTSGDNLTADNLTCWGQTTSDADGDTITNVFNWYKDDASLAVLNMPFDFDNSGGAGVTKDYSSRENDGDIDGPTWISSGLIGGAYDFDGGNDYISVTDDSTLDITGNITVLLWARLDVVDTMEGIMYKGDRVFTDDSSQQSPYSISKHSNNFVYLDIGGDAADERCSRSRDVSGIIGDGNFHFYALRYNKTHTQAWLDTSASTPLACTYDVGTNNDPVEIGVANGWTAGEGWQDRFLNGAVDEVHIYDSALSDEQIMQVYLDTKDGFTTNRTLVTNETKDSDVYICEVTPNDAVEDGTAKNSSSLTIGTSNSAPTIDASAIIPMNADYSIDMNCSFTVGDTDAGDTHTVDVMWWNGTGNYTEIADVSGISCTKNQECFTTDLVLRDNTSFGETWICSTQAYDGTDYSPWVNASRTIASSYLMLNKSIANGTVEAANYSIELDLSLLSQTNSNVRFIDLIPHGFTANGFSSPQNSTDSVGKGTTYIWNYLMSGPRTDVFTFNITGTGSYQLGDSFVIGLDPF